MERIVSCAIMMGFLLILSITIATATIAMSSLRSTQPQTGITLNILLAFCVFASVVTCLVAASVMKNALEILG